jgi:hypothetical protein
MCEVSTHNNTTVAGITPVGAAAAAITGIDNFQKISRN